MAVSLVRVHTGTDSTDSGATITATIAAATTAGNLLLAAVAGRTMAAPAVGLSKPVGETADWTRIGSHTAGQVTAELWVIRPDTSWPKDTTVTATYAAAVNRRAILLAEFSGVDDVVRAAAASAVSTTGAVSVLTTDGGPGTETAVGDLVVGLASMQADYFFDKIVPDSDTLAGTWVETAKSGRRITFGDNGGLNVTLEHKAVTATGQQRFDVTYLNDYSGEPKGPRTVGATVVVLRTTNVPPNAPALVWPVADQVINRGAVNRFRWTFSDPNPSDIQSGADLRWKLTGDTDWITIHVDTWYTIYDQGPLTFEAGEHEWQARTYDALGAVGPWCASGFFVADDPPAGPAITYPIAGQDVDQYDRVDWTVASQEAWRVRRVADNAGAPDTTVVYYDSLEQGDTVARAAPLEFPVKDRPEHVQVQIRDGGLWSAWVDVFVNVSYSPPPAPTFEVHRDESTGSLQIDVTNPAPAEGDPAAVFNRVYITEPLPSGVVAEERRKDGLPVDGTWRYWNPVGGWEYGGGRIRVESVAANGTTASSS